MDKSFIKFINKEGQCVLCIIIHKKDKEDIEEYLFDIMANLDTTNFGLFTDAYDDDFYISSEMLETFFIKITDTG
jgi:hypothetical protein